MTPEDRAREAMEPYVGMVGYSELLDVITQAIKEATAGIQEELDYLRGERSNMLDHFEVLEHEAIKVLDLDRYRTHLYDLLSLIHRDGGHYTDKHGVRKSVEDAIKRVSELNALYDNTHNPPVTKEYVDRLASQMQTDYKGGPQEKTLTNTTASQAKDNVSDLQVWGDGDTFKLICKASSQQEGWMKSTKAMEIDGLGCVVQVTTQQRNPDGSYAVAEATTFVPDVKLADYYGTGGETIGRVLVRSKR